jgi:hypothetical protein
VVTHDLVSIITAPKKSCDENINDKNVTSSSISFFVSGATKEGLGKIYPYGGATQYNLINPNISLPYKGGCSKEYSYSLTVHYGNIDIISICLFFQARLHLLAHDHNFYYNSTKFKVCAV